MRCGPHVPVRLSRYKLDVLSRAGSACIGAEPRPQHVGQDVARVAALLGNVQRDLDESACVDDVVRDERSFAFWQRWVVLAIEHEDGSTLGLYDFQSRGRAQQPWLGEEISGEPIIDKLPHHGIEGFAYISADAERRDEPLAVDAEPAAGGSSQLARPGRQRPSKPIVTPCAGTCGSGIRHLSRTSVHL